MNGSEQVLVETIRERCRLCYTCVRECPAKAIRIVAGQAEVISDRCIGCGNCVKVCSQKAKRVLSSVEAVEEILCGRETVVAIIAPAFPAEFDEIGARRFVGMLRALGFGYVVEVAFGADLVAREHKRQLEQFPRHHYIASSCPAVVSYVEKYHPALVPNLSPIISPMIATARVVREIHGADARVVFVGPCIAKKEEARREPLGTAVDAVLTFDEIRTLFIKRGIRADKSQSSDFDPPFPCRGMVFPLTRGLIQTAGLDESFVGGDVATADGRKRFTEAIREYDLVAQEAHLLEILCCNGCIMGPGMTTLAPYYRRHKCIRDYASASVSSLREEDPYAGRFDGLDLQRTFKKNDQRIETPSEETINGILREMGKTCTQDELNCGACGYESCRDHAVAIARGLAEHEMCLPYTIEKLKETVQAVTQAHQDLEQAQASLMKSERLASMGQLAAGIAHEVNNPLGVVLLYSHMLLEKSEQTSEQFEDLSTIVEETNRCKKIVAGLLHFARQNKVDRRPSDLVKLVESCVKALRAGIGVRLITAHEREEAVADVDPDQIVQVITNLVNNAADAITGDGVIAVRTGLDERWVHLEIEDNGSGIPDTSLPRIFEPFYTTKKQTGGTGLGLAVTYGIVKTHRGKIDVSSNADPSQGPTWTTFHIRLPREPMEKNE